MATWLVPQSQAGATMAMTIPSIPAAARISTSRDRSR
jgi:hypothetical protein